MHYETKLSKTDFQLLLMALEKFEDESKVCQDARHILVSNTRVVEDFTPISHFRNRLNNESFHHQVIQPKR